VIASLIAVVAGLALSAVSVRRATFDRFLGPSLRMQYKVQSRLPAVFHQSENGFVPTARLVAIVLGVLLIALGLTGIIAITV
jgi:hypothetical protein